MAVILSAFCAENFRAESLCTENFSAENFDAENFGAGIPGAKKRKRKRKMKHKLKIVVNAPVVISFVLLMFIATLAGILTNGSATNMLLSTYRSSLLSPMTYIRLFTHVLGHTGWSHFLGNATYILLLGPMLEEKYGSDKVLEVILTTALVTALLNFFLFPGVALCGASGVVFAFILLTSFTSFNEGEIPLTVILVAVIFIGQQVYEGLFLQDSVSNLSHIAGGIIGAVIGYQLNKRTK
jgi:GlpG protein